MNKYPLIEIYLQGIKLELNFRDYINPEFEYFGLCYIGIDVSDMGIMIFGDVVMRKYITVFDKSNNKVGIKG